MAGFGKARNGGSKRGERPLPGLEGPGEEAETLPLDGDRPDVTRGRITRPERPAAGRTRLVPHAQEPRRLSGREAHVEIAQGNRETVTARLQPRLLAGPGVVEAGGPFARGKRQELL